MLVQLDVPFRDAAADDLAWSLLPGASAPAALASAEVALGDLRLRLHVLGASHAVEVAAGDRRLTEVVAYGAPDGRTLAAAPASVERDGLRYRFAATVERPGRAAVAALGAELRADGGGRDRLLAAFPGTPDALTALRLLPDAEPGWESWHLYPERGEVVRTRTTVTVVEEPAP
ncbi:DUF2617 family protein [Patulibacter defluvii]|uniref:DUF2617 family protein n=1 Tax=Patulibacter defluvii TaxID=3095358 RepID=UPI002A755D2B|nr:DUF2617 family protein [Patulibacter sp. DM4]